MFMFRTDVVQLEDAFEELEYAIKDAIADSVLEVAPHLDSMEVTDTICVMLNLGLPTDVDGILDFMELHSDAEDDGSISTSYTVVR